MITAKGIQGKYLEYMGKPLVRYDNEIYYGDMADKYILFLMVMQQKKIEKLNVEVPSKVMVQILNTKNMKEVKQNTMVDSLADAFELGMAWLERANRN